MIFFLMKLGDEKHTHFWKDRWCGDVILKNEFMELYKIQRDKNCKVWDRIISDNEAVFHGLWRRNQRRGREVVELERLSNMMVGIVLCNSLDSWEWSICNSKSLFVNSLRGMMANSMEFNHITRDFYPVDWIPIKVNCFVWRVFCNRISVACKLVEKDVNLLLTLCPFVLI